MEVQAYNVSTERDRMDVDFIHEFLSARSYWAKGRAREIVARSIETSLCFGVFSSDGRQVGFARLVTDSVTFGWLCDVFIDEAHRGKGLGKKLIQAVVSDPRVKGIKRIMLGTRDAHELYQRYGGFQPLASPETWMERSGA